MKQNFIDIMVPYEDEKGEPIPSEIQAKVIIEKMRQILKENPTLKGCAIIYSANFDQLKQAVQTYKQNGSITGIRGMNQAGVINALEEKIQNEDKDLLGKMNVIPIPTCLKPGGEHEVTDDMTKFSLQNTACYLGSGWAVLGWKNQSSGDQYAIGGGVCKLPQSQNDMIQGFFKEAQKNSDINTWDKSYNLFKAPYNLGKAFKTPYCHINKNDLPPVPLQPKLAERTPPYDAKTKTLVPDATPSTISSFTLPTEFDIPDLDQHQSPPSDASSDEKKNSRISVVTEEAEDKELNPSHLFMRMPKKRKAEDQTVAEDAVVPKDEAVIEVQGQQLTH